MLNLLHVSLFAAAAVAQGCNMAAGDPTPPRPADDPAQCLATADGMMTFMIWSSLIEIPNPGQPAGTFQSYQGLELIDSHCTVLGSYNWDTCGIPAMIQEPFLQHTLSVSAVQADVGGCAMHFTYGDTSYDTNSSQRCKCGKDPSGLEAKAYCSCQFPVSGTDAPYYVGPDAGIIPPSRKSKRAPRIANELKTEVKL